jgi:transcriptional regulator with XRE-family HTH domain
MTSKRAARPSLGQRIGLLRAERGWTQADLAARLGLSRVAISHFEMGLAVPSERTVVLLAGLFKRGPHELVAGTDYPVGKSDRLPLVACRYTEIELQVQLLRRDLDWLRRIAAGPTWRTLAAATLAAWAAELARLSDEVMDPTERALLREARQALADLKDVNGSSERRPLPVGD